MRGILPFTFANEADYDNIELGDELRLPEVRALITEGKPVRARKRDEERVLSPRLFLLTAADRHGSSQAVCLTTRAKTLIKETIQYGGRKDGRSKD